MQNISINGDTYKTLRNPMPVVLDIPNVVWRKTAEGGKARATKYGNPARFRGYTLWLDLPTDETTWDALIATLDGYASTFTLIDHNGDTFTAYFSAVGSKDPIEDDVIIIAVEITESDP